MADYKPPFGLAGMNK